MGTKTQKLSNVVDQIVEWQSVFTGDGSTGLTAVAGRGYFIDTTSGTVTVTLPASPKAGDKISIKDYAATFSTNNVTVARNGNNIEGSASDVTLNASRGVLDLIYVDNSQGWIGISSGAEGAIIPTFITATGGTVTTSGDYKIHTFTGDGCFVVSSVGNPSGSTSVDYLVVAGGGSNGSNYGGGGGAGGFRESSGTASGCYTASPLGACVSALPVTTTSYPVTVGGGGAATNCGASVGNSGNNSIFSTITSTGGGGGGNSGGNGLNGGSGGGSGNNPGPSGGTGNTPPVSPPQGNNGQTSSIPNEAGGGGGAGEAGGTDGGGFGGDGVQTSISGCATFYAGGAGGYSNIIGDVRPGGDGGGGGGPTPAGGPFAGVANTGGGASYSNVAPNSYSGGSGIVIIRYKFQ